MFNINMWLDAEIFIVIHCFLTVLIMRVNKLSFIFIYLFKNK